MGVYRAPTQPVQQEVSPQKEGGRIASSEIKGEPPYTDYEKVHGHPYVVDHFKLGDTWRDKLGGFEKEVASIEGYFKDRIDKGLMRNDTTAVKEQLNKLYKLCNIDTSERTTMQIEKLVAHIEYLKKIDNINLNNMRYGK